MAISLEIAIKPAQTTSTAESRAGLAQRKRTDCSRSARSSTKPAAKMINEQRIENANFTSSFNVSMALIFLTTKNLMTKNGS